MQNNKLKLYVERTISGEDLPLPEYKSEGASGMDLFAAVKKPIVIKPGSRALIPTGLKIELPDGFEGQVRPRSGLAVNHGLTVLNAPGTIDSDYRGEIKVPIINLGEESYTIVYGIRIAQLVIVPITKVELDIVENLKFTKRGSQGFGHTGI